jgi:hypothetical protein
MGLIDPSSSLNVDLSFLNFVWSLALRLLIGVKGLHGGEREDFELYSFGSMRHRRF